MLIFNNNNIVMYFTGKNKSRITETTSWKQWKSSLDNEWVSENKNTHSRLKGWAIPIFFSVIVINHFYIPWDAMSSQTTVNQLDFVYQS